YQGDPVAQATISDPVVLEGDPNSTSVTFTVKLSAPLATDVSVHFATRDDTAKAASDYLNQSGTVTIPAGQTSKTIPIPLVSDHTAEDNETFFVDLSNPVGDIVITKATGQATVVDDDAASSSLSGFVYADSNFNGIRDGGEAGFSGVTITLLRKAHVSGRQFL